MRNSNEDESEEADELEAQSMQIPAATVASCYSMPPEVGPRAPKRRPEEGQQIESRTTVEITATNEQTTNSRNGEQAKVNTKMEPNLECMSNSNNNDDSSNNNNNDNKSEITPNAANGLDNSNANLDSGYAWLILVVMFLLQSTISGSSRVYGVVYAKQVAIGYYDREDASWPIATASAVENLAGILTPALAKFVSWRKIELLSSSLFILANLGAYLSNSLTIDILCLGVIQGLALSISTILALAINNDYFERYRTTAYGISMSGSAFGVLYLSPVVAWLLENYDNFRLVYLALAIVFSFNIGLVLFIKPRQSNKQKRAQRMKAQQERQQQQQLQYYHPDRRDTLTRKISRLEYHLERSSSIASISVQCKSRRQSAWQRTGSHRSCATDSSWTGNGPRSRTIHANDGQCQTIGASYMANPRERKQVIVNGKTIANPSTVAKNLSSMDKYQLTDDTATIINTNDLARKLAKISLASLNATSLPDPDCYNKELCSKHEIEHEMGAKSYGSNPLTQVSDQHQRNLVASWLTTNAPHNNSSSNNNNDNTTGLAEDTKQQACQNETINNSKRCAPDCPSKEIIRAEKKCCKRVQEQDDIGRDDKYGDEPTSGGDFSLEATLELLRLPYLHCVWIMLTIYYLISRVLMIILVDFADDHGLDFDDSRRLLNYWSLGELLGRIMLGSFIDLQWLSIKHCITLTCSLLALFISLMVVVESYYVYATCATLIAALVSLEYMLINVLMIEYIGKHRVTSCYSIAAFISSLVLFGRPTLIGLFRDKLGSYDGLLMLLAVVTFAYAFLFILLEPLLVRKWPKCKQ